jgi:hypothetical protein
MSAIRYRLSPQLKFNIKMHLDLLFLNDGLFVNVASGHFDVTGERADVLRRVTGNLYESAFDNWIFETDASGVGGFVPLNASGVIIDGVLNLKGSSPYKPEIDYRNGRVFFTGTPVSSTSEVSAEFGYKHINVDYRQSRAINLLFTALKDSVDFAQVSFPSGVQRQLPAVVIDIQRRLSQPYSLGGAKTHDTLVVLHVLSNTDHEFDQIIDILTEKSFRQPIKAIDFNNIPELFTDLGDRAATYKNLTELRGDISLQFPTIFIDKADLIESFEQNGLRYARVHWNAIVNKNLSP